MGCWDYRILCDDGALDAFDELEESENLAADIERMLDDVLAKKDGLEYDVCEYGLVAAALVAVSAGNAGWVLLSDFPLETDEQREHYNEYYAVLIDRAKAEDLSRLKGKAAETFRIVKSGESELYGLWEENEELFPKWIENIDRLIETLK